mmetsp:Transcript_56369/g.164797  ORF Transcript_56369/g.164797 Transcript_56369/m.164797 type:complete len:578 (+) Transcript_56369:15-1748(+)
MHTSSHQPASTSPPTPSAANSRRAVLQQITRKEGCILWSVGSDLGDQMQSSPLVLDVHKLVTTAVLEGVHAGHGSGTWSQFLVQISLHAAPEPRLPPGHVLDADALGEVLAAEDRSGRRNRLRPVYQEFCVDGRELDQVVCKAEALLRPTSLPEVPSQEGIRRGLVEAETQDLPHFSCPASHLLISASPICDEGQPRRELRSLLRVFFALVNSRGQRAGDAGELQLRAGHAPKRQIGVHVAEGPEEHLLWVALAVQRCRGRAAVVHLGDPVEEHRPRHTGDLGGLHGVKLQKDFAPGGREQRLLAGGAEAVPPEVQLLERRVHSKCRRQRLRTSIAYGVVAEREPPEVRGAAQHGRERRGASVADAVVTQAELAHGAAARRRQRLRHGSGAEVAQGEPAELLIWPKGWGQPPLKVPRSLADQAHAGTVCKRRQQVQAALQQLRQELLQPQPRVPRPQGWRCPRGQASATARSQLDYPSTNRWHSLCLDSLPRTFVWCAGTGSETAWLRHRLRGGHCPGAAYLQHLLGHATALRGRTASQRAGSQSLWRPTQGQLRHTGTSCPLYEAPSSCPLWGVTP